MGVDKVIGYALSLAMVYAAGGTLGFATFAVMVKASESVQHKQISYAKFNRMLHQPRVRPK